MEWIPEGVRMLDQTRLPGEERHLLCRTAAEVASAISAMVVRGAPAIGVAAAYGTALAAREETFRPGALAAGVAMLRDSRPTAHDLFWAVDRVLWAAAAGPDAALEEAHRIASTTVAACARMGAHGRELLAPAARVLTICNTGALACVDHGTALGVIRSAHEAGREPFVWVMETRPRAQGARLTVWELRQLGIPHRLLTDSAIGRLFQTGMVDVAIAGADRIAANGDTANKVGTYVLARMAALHQVPFYVAAPTSTFDRGCPDGSAIVIEERPAEEVTTFAPAGTPAYNPAFDVTPASLITAFVTECGVLRPPFRPGIASLPDPMPPVGAQARPGS